MLSKFVGKSIASRSAFVPLLSVPVSRLFSIQSLFSRAMSTTQETKKSEHGISTIGNDYSSLAEEALRRQRLGYDPTKNVPQIVITVNKAKQATKIGLSYALLLAILAGVGITLNQLAPRKMSTSGMFNSALGLVQKNHEVRGLLGESIRGCGIDPDVSRRNYIPSYRYQLHGKKYCRIVFKVEGRHGSGYVYAERKAGSSDFNYIIVKVPQGKRNIVVTVVDNRKKDSSAVVDAAEHH